MLYWLNWKIVIYLPILVVQSLGKMNCCYRWRVFECGVTALTPKSALWRAIIFGHLSTLLYTSYASPLPCGWLQQIDCCQHIDAFPCLGMAFQTANKLICLPTWTCRGKCSNWFSELCLSIIVHINDTTVFIRTVCNCIPNKNGRTESNMLS